MGGLFGEDAMVEEVVEAMATMMERRVVSFMMLRLVRIETLLN